MKSDALQCVMETHLQWLHVLNYHAWAKSFVNFGGVADVYSEVFLSSGFHMASDISSSRSGW